MFVTWNLVMPWLESAPEYKEPRNEFEIRSHNVNGEARDVDDFKSVFAVRDKESDDLRSAARSDVDIDSTMDGETQGRAQELRLVTQIRTTRMTPTKHPTKHQNKQ
ncbi:hypothetical protein Dimus_022545 [Dionaea muscipula]